MPSCRLAKSERKAARIIKTAQGMYPLDCPTAGRVRNPTPIIELTTVRIDARIEPGSILENHRWVQDLLADACPSQGGSSQISSYPNTIGFSSDFWESTSVSSLKILRAAFFFWEARDLPVLTDSPRLALLSIDLVLHE